MIELNRIYNEDCLEGMKQIPDNSIDLVVTSPPYNKSFYDKHTPSKHDVWKQRNIKYENFNDDMQPEKYREWQKTLLQEMVRIIKPEGSIFYNHKSFSVKHKLNFPTFVFDFNVRQLIIWDRKSTPQLAPIRFLPTTEYVFWITKSNIQPKFYNNELIFKKEVWELAAKPMLDHPAPFPIEIPTNCILATTDKNDIVLDPFMGSGTTALACCNTGRNYIGFEISSEYCDLANKRIHDQEAQMSLFKL